MKKLITVALFIISLGTSAQEPSVSSSIFSYDTCAPPCWLGIIPGVSTSFDVDLVLAQRPDIIDLETINKSASQLFNSKFAIDEDTGKIQSGVYFFDVLTPPSNILAGIRSRIEIRKGVVDLIFILGTEEYDIQLSNALEHLGMPDQVRIAYFDYNNQVSFYFIYLDSQLRINLDQTIEQCDITNLPDSFSVNSILYHSERSAQEPFQTYDYDVQQPALIRFSFESERNIPLDIWQSWLDGEVDESCFEAWRKLSPPQIEITQDSVGTNSEVQIKSLFPYNTCVEPCWLGLIPGISTSLDVDDVLENFDNIVTIEEYGESISRSEKGEWAVDEDTGIVQSGGYTFDVLTPSSQFSIITSRIEIQNGLIDLGVAILDW